MSATALRAPSRSWLHLLRIAAALALGVALYLVRLSVQADTPGCGSGDCAEMFSARWAYWFSIPVAAFAALLYLTVLIASSLIESDRRRVSSIAWAVLTVAALTCGGSALWFLTLSVALRKWCPYCLICHACEVTICCAVSVQSRRAPRSRVPRGLALTGTFAAMAVLIIGQLSHHSSARVLTTGLATNPSTARTAAEVSVAGNSSANLPVDLDEFPVIGPPSASHRVLVLTDYTCPHCRQLHSFLPEVLARFPGQVCFELLPVPLDPKCNPAVRRADPVHENACALARVALSVWRAKPSTFDEFDSWLFAAPEPPSASDALRRAQELVGQESLLAAEEKNPPEESIRRSVRVYQSTGVTRLPQLVIPRHAVVGIHSADELCRILKTELVLTARH